MKRFALTLLLMACITTIYAQKEPRGKAIVQIFTNFHTGFGDENDDRGFELERSYIGYEYELPHNITIKGIMDIGRSNDVNDYQRIAYVKNAMLSWKNGSFTLNGGLIGTTLFNYQEQFWGYRYIYRSFQDLYGFGHSADLGISASYDFYGMFSLDAIVVNGEGFKRIQRKDGLQYGIGATITPLRGLSMRLYAGINENNGNSSNTVNYSMFTGYRNRYFSFGLEYDIVRNFLGENSNHLYGFSMYAHGTLNNWLDIYARTDGLMSRDDWNKNKDEITLLAGAQFKLGKYIKVAPNFRMAIPATDNISNRYYAYISCSFGL